MNVEDIFWVGAVQVSKLICVGHINRKNLQVSKLICAGHINKILDGIIHICGWHMENKIKPIVTNQTKLNKTLKSMEIDYNVVRIFP